MAQGQDWPKCSFSLLPPMSLPLCFSVSPLSPLTISATLLSPSSSASSPSPFCCCYVSIPSSSSSSSSSGTFAGRESIRPNCCGHHHHCSGLFRDRPRAQLTTTLSSSQVNRRGREGAKGPKITAGCAGTPSWATPMASSQFFGLSPMQIFEHPISVVGNFKIHISCFCILLSHKNSSLAIIRNLLKRERIRSQQTTKICNNRELLILSNWRHILNITVNPFYHFYS